MATKEKAGGKAGSKGGAAKGGAAQKGGAAKGGAAKGGSKGGKQGGQPRQAMDFTKREHAGAGLPVAAPRLKAHYEQTVRAKLAQQFGFTNPHEVPTLEKIVINCGVGEAVKQPKLLDVVVEELALITGQKPVRRKAKKSVANFGLREGQEIGASVTMRGARMWEFLDRFVTVACPRIRDFRGLGTKSFDGRGNYTLGIKEQMIFPEINYDMVEQIHGMDITFVTSAEKDAHAFALLHQLGMPFRGDDKPVTPKVAQPNAA
ncbi:MAG: ribosomal protein [Gemmatimonadota bacterium]|jgi:large subunit ribosomal protein L5